MTYTPKQDIFKRIGAHGHAIQERDMDDYYSTNPEAIDHLLTVDSPYHTVWECACGGGNLSKRLEKYGFDVISTDKFDRGYGGIQDFLLADTTPVKECDILTNPPFYYTVDFIRKALEIIPDGHRVFMFLKLNYLEGQKRYDKVFRENPPEYVYVFIKRIYCGIRNDDDVDSKHSAIAYAWYVWRKGFKGDPKIKWI